MPAFRPHFPQSRPQLPSRCPQILQIDDKWAAKKAANLPANLARRLAANCPQTPHKMSAKQPANSNWHLCLCVTRRVRARVSHEEFVPACHTRSSCPCVTRGVRARVSHEEFVPVCHTWPRTPLHRPAVRYLVATFCARSSLFTKGSLQDAYKAHTCATPRKWEWEWE
eukprot:gene2714-biopygen4406